MLRNQNLFIFYNTRADLEVQLMQQNHCDEVLSNDSNTLLGQQISQHTAISMSRSALATYMIAYQNLNIQDVQQKNDIHVARGLRI